MGFRVGEVTPFLAIAWTRATAVAEPHWKGKPPKIKESPTRVLVENEAIPIPEREGAVPGARGQVRLVLSEKPELAGARPIELCQDVPAAGGPALHLFPVEFGDQLHPPLSFVGVSPLCVGLPV